MPLRSALPRSQGTYILGRTGRSPYAAANAPTAEQSVMACKNEWAITFWSQHVYNGVMLCFKNFSMKTKEQMLLLLWFIDSVFALFASGTNLNAESGTTKPPPAKCRRYIIRNIEQQYFLMMTTTSWMCQFEMSIILLANVRYIVRNNGTQKWKNTRTDYLMSMMTSW